MSSSPPQTTSYQAYRESVRADVSTGKSVRNLCVLGFTITALFVPIEFVAFPELFPIFFKWRVGTNLILAYIFFRASYHRPIESAITVHMAVGAMIVVMITYQGGVKSLYGSGLVLIFCALPVLVPLSVGQVALAIAPSLTAFLALPLYTEPITLKVYALHAIFPSAGALIAIGSTWVLEEIRLSEFVRRRQLEEAQDHLRALDAAKSRFTANVHHELRTPLTLILSPLEGMLASAFGAVPDHLQTHLTSMRSNGLRLLKLINDLLDLAKLESHQMKIRRRELEITKLLGDVASGAQGMAQQRGVEIHLDFDPELPWINADRDALEKVFVNLIGNSLKFTPSGGQIHVAARAKQEGVIATVRDTGMGLPQDQLERIFDRFAQVDTSATRRHEGTGIGLSLVKEIVELHGGKVWAESPGLGQGASIHVELPIGEGDLIAEEAVQGSSPQAPLRHAAFDTLRAQVLDSNDEIEHGSSGVAGESAGGDSKSVDGGAEDTRSEVLVVEDNPDMRRLLQALLSTAFRVRTAPNGRAGLEAIRARRPDVILSDIMMPEMSGLDLCGAVKSDPETRGVPFILVTSKGEREMRVEGLEKGADDYVEKPFHPRELLARVRSFARLRQLQEDVEERNVALNDSLAALKQAQAQLVHREKMSSLGQLVAGVAHELNNPIGFIQGNLGFLEEHVRSVLKLLERYEEELQSDVERHARIRRLRDESKADYLLSDLDSVLAGIREGVERTVGIVGDLRTFSTLDRSDVIHVDLRKSVDSTLNLLRARLRPVHVVREYADVPTVECLAGQVNQVFMNLLTNACDAIGSPGEIRIRIGMEDASRVFVEIQDNGSGMSHDVQQRIFEPFFTTKEVGKGTGLGLSISHGVIQRHCGSIQVTSAPGEGSRFRVILPVAFSGSNSAPHTE